MSPSTMQTSWCKANIAVACATAVVTYLALDRAMSRDSTSQAYQTVDLMKPSTSALTAFPRTAVPKTTYQAQPMEASQYEDVSGVPAQQVGVGVVPQQPRQPSQMLQNVAMLLLAPLSVVAAALLWRKGHGARPRMAMMSYSGTPYSSILPHTAPAKVPRTVLYGKNKNDNFIDQTFTVVADQLLKFLPTTKREKKAFMYYRDGMSAQGVGEYAEALQNYYEALKLETDPYDRSYILYNIGLIHASNGELEKALEYYYQALERNPNLPSALNNIAVIYHFQAETAEQDGRAEDAIEFYDKAADYWKEAIRLAPTNYMEAQNWLQARGELSPDRPY